MNDICLPCSTPILPFFSRLGLRCHEHNKHAPRHTSLPAPAEPPGGHNTRFPLPICLSHPITPCILAAMRLSPRECCSCSEQDEQMSNTTQAAPPSCQEVHQREKPSSSPPQPHQEKRTCWGTCSNAFHLWNEPMNNGSSIHAHKRDILLHGTSKEMFTLFNIYNNLIYRGFIYLGSTVAEK